LRHLESIWVAVKWMTDDGKNQTNGKIVLLFLEEHWSMNITQFHYKQAPYHKSLFKNSFYGLDCIATIQRKLKPKTNNQTFFSVPFLGS